MQKVVVTGRKPYLLVTCLILLAFLISVCSMFFVARHGQRGVFSPSLKMNPLFSDSVIANAGGTFSCQVPTAPVHCYSPAQIRKAYGFQPLLDKGITGKGSTIVIVDAYQAPTIRHDLDLFDSTFGLPTPTLNIFTPDGTVPYVGDANQVGWAGEISLDVEWSHAIAPDATIDLVLAKTSDDPNILSAIKYAVDNNLGDVISMSFGENEACLAGDPLEWHKVFASATRKGITLFASSGDEGAAQTTCDGAQYVQAASTPANDTLVTGVGGTQLKADLDGNYQSETAWNEPDFQIGTGGGFSKIFKKPFYQYGLSAIPGNQRGVPDIAYNAAVDGGVLTVWSEGSRGADHLSIFGGTSAGSPQWAGLVALARQLGNHRLGLINPSLYFIGRVQSLYKNVLHDITTGTNTITIDNPDGSGTVTVQGFDAAPGWDAATGWGTPKASLLVPLLSVVAHDHESEFSRQSASLLN